ncbi:MAG: glucose 1-dehydrogenase [Candidatus Poribacteria bacterium]|nr:glucose 1-dehydrogenase [Candidatus Poribacteria bacterium]
MKAKYDFSEGERGKFYDAKAVFNILNSHEEDIGQKMRLNNKIAIVTGAGRGIGKAVALRFAEEGAKVVIDDLNDANGAATVSAITDAGGEAQFVNADVADTTDVKRLIAKTVDAYGTIDILVNNAICSTADVLNNNWEANLAVALQGTSHCSNAVVPVMQKGGGGSIVNIASVNGLIGLQAIHAYSAAKGGVIALTRSMAVAHGKDNIRINCICPGTIQTEVWEPMIERNPQILDEITPWYPLGRIGQPIDIANTALFLASDEASFATGAIFVIDGGLTAGNHQFPI